MPSCTGLDLQMRGGGDASRRDASMCDEEEADGMETTDVAGEEEEGGFVSFTVQQYAYAL